MRGILGLVRRRCIALQQQQQFAVPHDPLPTPTSWLSSAASASGSGGKKDSSRGNNNTSSSSSNGNKDKGGASLRNSAQTSKRMTDAVKEKARAKGARAGAGDQISSDRVKHDRSSKRFTLDLGNNQLARIDYRTIGPQNRIEMYHSEVPAELQGRGLGKALARGALEQAARENMRVKLTCTFLIDFVNKSTDPKLKHGLDSSNNNDGSTKHKNK